MHLTNYDLDALAQIDVKGLGLVFRAASSRDYQVARLVVEGSGPMPSLALARYAMISGQPSRAVRTPYPSRLQADTLYRVHLEVRGDAFSLYIQGNLVDYWRIAGWPAAAWACSAPRANMRAWPGSAFRTMQTP